MEKERTNIHEIREKAGENKKLIRKTILVKAKLNKPETTATEKSTKQNAIKRVERT